MVTTTTIKIKEGTILNKAGDNHILVYSASGDYYYAVPLSRIVRYEDDAINALKEESKARDTEQDKKFEAFKEEVEKKIEEMDEADKIRDEKVDEMIKNFKSSMEAVFKMIEELQGGSK